MKQIKVDVKEVEEKAMFLHKHIGDGSLGDKKFNASFTLPDHSILVETDGKRYLVSFQDIVEEVLYLSDKK